MKHWIEAARVRTLPLSVSGIILGSFYALSHATFNWWIVTFALTTTLGLQILSNFANDYGDGVKGTDNQDRIGPQRAIQSGVISPAEMKRAMILTSVLTFISAVTLIYFSFKDRYLWFSLVFLILGGLAIASAIRYTVGSSAYGYRGLGDVFVFIFFGWVSTIGIHFMFVKELDAQLFLPATAIGFLSVAVLNLNNLRDQISDAAAGKRTLIVKLGAGFGRKYHYFLILSSLILVLVFAYLQEFQIDQYLFLLAYIPLLLHLKRFSAISKPADYDPELKKVALSTFALSVLLSLSLIFFFQDIFIQIFKSISNAL